MSQEFARWTSLQCEEGDHGECLGGPERPLHHLYPCECECHDTKE